jgi:hypothetical protein
VDHSRFLSLFLLSFQMLIMQSRLVCSCLLLLLDMFPILLLSVCPLWLLLPGMLVVDFILKSLCLPLNILACRCLGPMTVVIYFALDSSLFHLDSMLIFEYCLPFLSFSIDPPNGADSSLSSSSSTKLLDCCRRSTVFLFEIPQMMY